MISKQEQQIIKSIAEKYQVKRIILFGSHLTKPGKKARDIDLAVEGIQANSFFKFYGDLLFGLKKAVDLFDLGSNTKFAAMVKKEGIPIYG